MEHELPGDVREAVEAGTAGDSTLSTCEACEVTWVTCCLKPDFVYLKGNNNRWYHKSVATASFSRAAPVG
jgi:hypothetical protein